MIGRIIQAIFNFVRQVSNFSAQRKKIRKHMQFNTYSTRIRGWWRDEVHKAGKDSLYAQVIIGVLIMLVLVIPWIWLDFFTQKGFFSVDLLLSRAGMIIGLIMATTAAMHLWQFLMDADEKLRKQIEEELEEEKARRRAAAMAEIAQTQPDAARPRYEEAAERRRPLPEGAYAPPPRMD